MLSKHGFKTTRNRSLLMRKIKSDNTKAEILLRKKLWSLGYRYRKNYKMLPGKPDIVLTKYKIAIFIDGEFWHGFNWDEKKNKIKSNKEYWINKIEANMKRDISNNEKLKEMGYIVIRFWEKEVLTNLDNCVDIVVDKISK